MVSKEKGKNAKLSSLGNEIEKSLEDALKRLREAGKKKPGKDDKGEHPKDEFSLTDWARIMDRAIKWEGIKMKAEDEEGSFFNDGDGGAD